MSCCDDPTEIHKIDPRELVREQQHYGNLVRDLFTDDPEKVLLKLLNESNAYLRELAALRAHYPSVRLRAIELLDKQSDAIRNAKTLLESYHPPDPATNKPSTTVHHLVEALNEAAERNKHSK